MKILDQSGDSLGEDVYRVSALYAAPEFVKAASRAQLDGLPEHPAHTFASPRDRQFSVATAAATWLSAALFEEKRAEFTEADAAEIENRLNSAAGYWGIVGELKRLREKVAGAARADDSALDDDNFALVMHYDNGTRERHCRLANPAEIKAAAAWLRSYRDEFVFNDRVTIARKVLSKAAATGVVLETSLSEFLEKQSALGTCAASTAVSFVRGRAAMVARRDEKLAADLRGVASVLESFGPEVRHPATLKKVAAAVDTVDRVSGLSREYDDGVDRPEDVLFAVTTKVASDFASSHVQLVTGSLFKLADLEKISVADVESALGTGVAEGLSSDSIHLDREKLADVLPTLPRGDAVVFERLVSQSEVEPVEKYASVRTGPGREALFTVAARLG